MGTTNLFVYFGIPTLFILLCMVAVGWITSKVKKRLVQKPLRWATAWGVLGCLIAISLAVAALVMNTDFVYNHASLVWPFCFSLAALNDKPSISAIFLVVGLMGVINGLYYALIAVLTWKIVQAIPKTPRPS
jgi:hypothetical protein